MPDIRHLRHFIAVAEEKHFRIAAERLNMTQPPLSQSIKKLEEELDVILFDRSKKKVELTSVGAVFLEGAYEMLEKMAQLENDTRRAAAGMIGRLNIGFTGSAVYDVLPWTVRQFRSQYPDVELEIHEMTTLEQIEAMIKGKLDAGLLRPPIFNADLFEIIQIQREEMIAVIPSTHRLAEQAAINLTDLSEDSFITFSHETSPNLHTLVMLACTEAGFTPKIIQTAPQIQTQISLVSAGLGVALVPKCAQNAIYPDVSYKQLSSPAGHIHTSMAVARSKTNKHAALDAFINICKCRDRRQSINKH